MRQIHGSTIGISTCVHLCVSNVPEILVLRHIGVQNITRLQNVGIQNIIAAVAPDRSEVRIVDLFTRTCRHAFDAKRLLIDPANGRCTRSRTLIGVVRTTRIVSQLTNDACHPVHQCLLCLFGAGLARRNTGIPLALRVFLIGTEVHGTLTVSTRLEITNSRFGRIDRILGVLDQILHRNRTRTTGNGIGHGDLILAGHLIGYQIVDVSTKGTTLTHENNRLIVLQVRLNRCCIGRTLLHVEALGIGVLLEEGRIGTTVCSTHTHLTRHGVGFHGIGRSFPVGSGNHSSSRGTTTFGIQTVDRCIPSGITLAIMLHGTLAIGSFPIVAIPCRVHFILALVVTFLEILNGSTEEVSDRSKDTLDTRENGTTDTCNAFPSFLQTVHGRGGCTGQYIPDRIRQRLGKERTKHGGKFSCIGTDINQCVACSGKHVRHARRNTSEEISYSRHCAGNRIGNIFCNKVDQCILRRIKTLQYEILDRPKAIQEFTRNRLHGIQNRIADLRKFVGSEVSDVECNTTDRFYCIGPKLADVLRDAGCEVLHTRCKPSDLVPCARGDIADKITDFGCTACNRRSNRFDAADNRAAYGLYTTSDCRANGLQQTLALCAIVVELLCIFFCGEIRAIGCIVRIRCSLKLLLILLPLFHGIFIRQCRIQNLCDLRLHKRETNGQNGTNRRRNDGQCTGYCTRYTSSNFHAKRCIRCRNTKCLVGFVHTSVEVGDGKTNGQQTTGTDRTQCTCNGRCSRRSHRLQTLRDCIVSNQTDHLGCSGSQFRYEFGTSDRLNDLVVQNRIENLRSCALYDRTNFACCGCNSITSFTCGFDELRSTGSGLGCFLAGFRVCCNIGKRLGNIICLGRIDEAGQEITSLGLPKTQLSYDLLQDILTGTGNTRSISLSNRFRAKDCCQNCRDYSASAQAENGFDNASDTTAFGKEGLDGLEETTLLFFLFGFLLVFGFNLTALAIVLLRGQSSFYLGIRLRSFNGTVVRFVRIKRSFCFLVDLHILPFPLTKFGCSSLLQITSFAGNLTKRRLGVRGIDSHGCIAFRTVLRSTLCGRFRTYSCTSSLFRTITSISIGTRGFIVIFRAKNRITANTKDVHGNRSGLTSAKLTCNTLDNIHNREVVDDASTVVDANRNRFLDRVKITTAHGNGTNLLDLLHGTLFLGSTESQETTNLTEGPRDTRTESTCCHLHTAKCSLAEELQTVPQTQCNFRCDRSNGINQTTNQSTEHMTQVFGCTSNSSSNVAKRCTNTRSSSKDHLAKSMDRRTDTLGCAYKDIANDLAKGLHCTQDRIFQ